MNRTAKLIVLVASCISCAGIAMSQDGPRTIEIHVKRFNFTPSDITVKKGETVQLKLISDDVPHSLVVKDLGINEAASKGHPGQATFTGKDAGTFQGQCGRFCGSGHGTMKFTVHVAGN